MWDKYVLLVVRDVLCSYVVIVMYRKELGMLGSYLVKFVTLLYEQFGKLQKLFVVIYQMYLPCALCSCCGCLVVDSSGG